MSDSTIRLNDVVLERTVPTRAEDLWRGWTEAAVLVKWFTPAPWVTSYAEIDPVPGGIFHTVMNGPNGERNEGTGCVLEAIPNRKFVWTSALAPGYVPNVSPTEGFHFTAVIELSQGPTGTLYRATARHSSQADADMHAEMGFQAGWGAALDQLVALFS